MKRNVQWWSWKKNSRKWLKTKNIAIKKIRIKSNKKTNKIKQSGTK
jgi:hypothetical protein